MSEPLSFEDISLPAGASVSVYGDPRRFGRKLAREEWEPRFPERWHTFLFPEEPGQDGALERLAVIERKGPGYHYFLIGPGSYLEALT